ncbi:TOPRIM nucleotidyl transferase/hydrolase domain-containing protein [Agromyces sp. CCNWLW203]|uniref:TOPRIM nucleotidyl transferase/hydrolase domain-containing protein n=1 Tax=Agromyces sp. CCNWLW203 TaxID=3112842 RepID=UPI002F964786
MQGEPGREASDTVVLVEGGSDRLAVAALAVRLGHDLGAAGVRVVSMDGVTNLHRHLGEIAGRRLRPRVLGLFDAAEIAYVRRAVDDAGLGSAATLDELAALGFFACDPDLEGELIRALGVERMQQLLTEHGELARFRGFQHQPAQRGRATDAQLRRFLGTHAGRKARFAPLMVDAIEEPRIPAAMRALVESAIGPSREVAGLSAARRRSDPPPR